MSDILKVGLTGSIGMGKSTAATIFRELGIPVHDADAAVHQLLDIKGDAVLKIASVFPDALVVHPNGDKSVNRQALGAHVFHDKDALKKLEAILHPLVREKTDNFVANHAAQGAEIVVLDIPLLFETKGEDRCDVIVVVNTSPAIQRERVLSRPGMSEKKFQAILSHQIPNDEKIKRADFVIHMEGGIEKAKADIENLLHNNLRPLIQKKHA